MTVYYEWDVEEVANERLTDSGQEFDKDDVMEHYFQSSFKCCREFKTNADDINSVNSRLEIVLVRDDDHGRAWAYLNSEGKLPEYFTDAYRRETTKVPKRFHDEVERAK